MIHQEGNTLLVYFFFKLKYILFWYKGLRRKERREDNEKVNWIRYKDPWTQPNLYDAKA